MISMDRTRAKDLTLSKDLTISTTKKMQMKNRRAIMTTSQRWEMIPIQTGSKILGIDSEDDDPDADLGLGAGL